MSKRWFNEHRADPWRRKARQEGYRARSAYKLKQIQEKFPVLRKGDIVLDVGCAPGGWTQVATDTVGEDGLVIGVDLQTTAPIEGALLIAGDIRDDLVRFLLVACLLLNHRRRLELQLGVFRLGREVE